MWDVLQNGVNVILTTTRKPASSRIGETNLNTNHTRTITPTELARREALDAKALYYLYFVLSLVKYNCVSSYETKTNIFPGKYKSFKMKPDESITDMSNKFTNIINGVAYQGKLISYEKKLNKFLEGFSKEWNNIKTII